jgi:hypothetical protein
MTCGCPKQTVIDICSMESPAERDGRLTTEEQKLSLEEMAVSQSATPMEKVQADLTHAYRVIQRMESREKWFVERIEQLEVFSKRVAGELAELRASCEATPSGCVSPSGGTTPKLTLQLGDVSLPDHERLAKNMRTSILKEDGMEAGMTPVAPLLPIPTHSLQKTVSWSDLSEPDPHKACILRGGGAGTHDDCPYCSNGQCTCGPLPFARSGRPALGGHSASVHMDALREKHGLGPAGEETPFLLPCPSMAFACRGQAGDAAFANCSPFIRDLYKAGLFHCPLGNLPSSKSSRLEKIELDSSS